MRLLNAQQLIIQVINIFSSGFSFISFKMYKTCTDIHDFRIQGINRLQKLFFNLRRTFSFVFRLRINPEYTAARFSYVYLRGFLI